MDTGGWGMAPSTLAQWAGAIGTISAVVVALFKDPIRGWWTKPNLRVTCTKQIPETVRVPITTWQGKWPGGGGNGWSGECYFVRIKVENRGRTRAEKVQVSALRLAKRGVDSNFADLPTTLPVSMKWSNSPPDGGVAILDGILSGMSAFCDIIGLCNPENPYQRKPAHTQPDATVGRLIMEFEPPHAEEWHLLAPGTFRLSLKIGAANVEPSDWNIEFTHDGKWTPDDEAMRRDHLAVSVKKA